jgi:RNA polymerase sigma factor (sigma-70 family)
MNPSSPRELELTPDLIDYAKRVAIKEARKRCPKHVDCDDVAQDVFLYLLSKPPKFDPSKGASEKTLIYTVVQRAVIKFVARTCRHAGRFTQVGDEAAENGSFQDDAGGWRSSGVRSSALMTEDMFRFIDSEESLRLCQLVLDCKGNVTEAARRMGIPVKTVRYRLKLLAPKLRAAGFDPFRKEGE